jgi:hypothetical protein
MQLPTLTTTKLGSLVLKRMVYGGKIEVGIGFDGISIKKFNVMASRPMV